MTKREKMLMVTIFYNPALITPQVITGTGPVTEEALFAGLEEHVEQGSLVRISHVEADLLRLACDQPGRPPAHEWVGLTFVPVQPATACTEPAEVAEPVQAVEEAIFMEEATHAY